MTTVRKFIICFLITAFTLCQTPVAAYTLIPEYLCDLGVGYFQKGEFTQALNQFKHVLVLEPKNPVALKYVALIHEARDAQNPSSAVPVIPPAAVTPPRIQTTPLPLPARSSEKPPKTRPASKIPVIVLDAAIASRQMPIILPKGRAMVVRGSNIRRYLITQERIVRVAQTGADELTVTALDLGYTYLHIWDERDRWTLEFLGTGPRPEGVPTVEEELLAADERNRDFRLRYSTSWQSFESGPDIDNLKQSSYAWSHWLELTGPTPYGDLDAATAVNTLRSSTDMTYLSLGLTNGVYNGLHDLNARIVDFTPRVSNLAFSSTSLRGAYLNTRAFDKTVDYTAFWGKEGGGKYWGLSPGLSKVRDASIGGMAVEYMPEEKQLYSFSAFGANGSDRDPTLRDSGYDAKIKRGFDRWNYSYELGYDTREFANLFSTAYQAPEFGITTELRNTGKDFKSMTGTGWRAGETGALVTSNYRPLEALNLGGRIDVYRDRLFPNPDAPGRLNEDSALTAGYRVDPTTSLHGDYSLQNDLGKISPVRSLNTGGGINKSFGRHGRFNTYATYRHQESTYFSSHVNDFLNEKLLVGIRFALISDLYYYYSHEYNWLNARYYRIHSNPWAMETGIDWNRQIFTSPFYGDMRVSYHNEENTEASPVSFLAGEDYLEWSTELSWRPGPDFETFASGRVRASWPEDTDGADRVDLSIYAGLRCTWDTGFQWDPVGALEGYAFKDDNQDGLRGQDETPVPGVKIKIGKDTAVSSDKNGYFFVQGIKGRKCAVMIDSATIPAGYVLTTPAVREIVIRHTKIERVDFGLASRTETAGIVFEDKNGNKLFDQGDKLLKGVRVTLEDGRGAVTDGSGKYIFHKMRAGKHTLRLDMNSLPPEYLPETAIFTDFGLTEGAAFIYNIPCKKVPTGDQRG